MARPILKTTRTVALKDAKLNEILEEFERELWSFDLGSSF